MKKPKPNHSFGLIAIFKKFLRETDRIGFNLADPSCSSRCILKARATLPGYYSSHYLTGTRNAGVALSTGQTAERPWEGNTHAEVYIENIWNWTRQTSTLQGQGKGKKEGLGMRKVHLEPGDELFSEGRVGVAVPTMKPVHPAGIRASNTPAQGWPPAHGITAVLLWLDNAKISTLFPSIGCLLPCGRTLCPLPWKQKIFLQASKQVTLKIHPYSLILNTQASSEEKRFS